MTKISVDNPGLVDNLGRMTFAKHLLNVIEDIDAESAGAVIGLEGEWGSGKTSIFKGLQTLVIGQEESIRVIKFNPWMVSGTTGLVETLLLQMAAELSDESFQKPNLLQRIKRLGSAAARGASLASDLVEYASVLGSIKQFATTANLYVPGSGIAIAGLGWAIDIIRNIAKPLARLKHHPAALSLSGAKQQVEKQLKQSGQRICVLVDDLDRLPPHELAAMIQAIKAVADFPNVVYVLAYDPEVAAKAIEKALQVDDGHAFLEKIIQLPLPLPQIPTRKFNLFAFKRLQSAIDVSDLSPDEKSDIEHAWNISAALMQTSTRC